MNHKLGLSIVMIIAGCADAPERDLAPSTDVQRELADLGIAGVRRAGDAVALLDASGGTIGSVTASGGATDVVLDDVHAHTLVDREHRTITCNDAVLDLVGDQGTLPATELAACHAPLRAAALVLRGDAALEPTRSELVSCTTDWITGCIEWDAMNGCTLYQECAVYTCDTGNWFRCWINYENW